jgi:hypothetical protein
MCVGGFRQRGSRLRDLPTSLGLPLRRTAAPPHRILAKSWKLILALGILILGEEEQDVVSHRDGDLDRFERSLCRASALGHVRSEFVRSAFC